MKELYEAYHLVKLLPYCLIVVTDVVACRVGVAGVEAYAYAALVLDAANDLGELIEGKADIAALPCGVLNDSSDALSLVEGDIDTLGNASQTLFFAELIEVTARVEVEHGEPQLLAAVHLIVEGSARLFQPLFLGVTQIDEVAVVGQYVACIVAILCAALLEEGNALLRKGL